ncbi:MULTISPECIES: AI-2E family transporter [unclassified Diaminobutyricimonas]|uniref:AI-2E family transporter n=1 Tax=unclassified Diaminobutyricimonas TaxID=2643261 RepID=UPI0012F50B08|nr:MULTISPECIES: AI-2E family transporter [unclassified Diaminobutyricimonas]
MRSRTRYLDRLTTEIARSGQQDHANLETAGSAPANTPRASLSQLWSDGLGRAGTRGAQILLIGALLAALVWLLTRLSIVTIPLVLALILAAAFTPWMTWTRRHGVPPAVGAALALLSLLAVITVALVFVGGSVSDEWRELAIKAEDGFQRVVACLQTLPFSPDQRQLDDFKEQISGWVTSAEFGSGALGGIGAVGEVGASLGMMAIILFFLLKDGPQMWEFLVRPFEGIAYARAERIRRKTVAVFGGYIRSTAAAALFDAVGILIGLLILQVPLAVPLAILTLLLAFIPIIGAVSGGAVAALVALVSNGPLNAALVVIVVIIVNQLEGNVLKPILMGKTVSLHALVVLVVIAAGTAVGGITGALLAVPLTAAAWGVVQVWDGDNLPARWARPKARDRRTLRSGET